MWGIAAILGCIVRSEEEKKAEKEHVMAIIGGRPNLQNGFLSGTSTSASAQAMAYQVYGQGLGASSTNTLAGAYQQVHMRRTTALPPSPTGKYECHYNHYHNTTTVTDGMGTILCVVDHNMGETFQLGQPGQAGQAGQADKATITFEKEPEKPKKDAGERYHELVEKVDVLEGKLSLKHTPSTDDLLDHLEFRVSEIERKLETISEVHTLCALPEPKTKAA